MLLIGRLTWMQIAPFQRVSVWQMRPQALSVQIVLVSILLWTAHRLWSKVGEWTWEHVCAIERKGMCVVIKNYGSWPRFFSSLGNGHSPVPLRSKSASCGGLEEWIKSFGLHYESHPSSSRRQSVLQCNSEPLPNQYWKKQHCLNQPPSRPPSLIIFSHPGVFCFLGSTQE